MIFNKKQKIIPIFFASDINYAPYLAVSIKSLLDNASKDFFYKIHVLTSNINQEIKDKLHKLTTENSSLEFINLSNQLESIKHKFHLRDYYSIETYYRFFIADLFPEYDKVLYLDCDITVLGDISDLYLTNISDYLVGAVPEQVMSHYEPFGNYVEQALDIKCKKYFNAGVLLMNTHMFRVCKIQQQFFSMMERFKFRVTQDEDYLNVICKDKVRYLSLGWNKMPFEETGFDNYDLQLIHYNLGWKPWHYENIMYEEYFWEYAYKTDFYKQIQESLHSYPEEKKQSDKDSFIKLQKMAIEDAKDFFNYKKTMIRDRKNHYLQKSLYYINRVPIIKDVSRIIVSRNTRIKYRIFQYLKSLKEFATALK